MPAKKTEKNENLKEDEVMRAEETDAGTTAEKSETETETTEVETAPVAKKQKKVVRKRKSKKEKESPILSAIRLTIEGGKVDFGYKLAIVSKPEAYVIALNTPANFRTGLLEKSSRDKTPILEFVGSSMELGALCGKPFPVSVLTVFDAGTSNLLSLAKKT